MRIGRGLFMAGLVAALAVTTACGSDSGGAAPTQPKVDPSQLDVGNLATKPKEYGKPTSLDQARAVVAMRMGNYVPLPMDIIGEVKHPPPATSGAIRLFIDYGSGAIKGRMKADTQRLSDTAPGLISGFVSAGRSSDKPTVSYELENLVMLFNTEQDATRAADAMATAEADTSPDYESVSIGKFPAAHVLTTKDQHWQFRSWAATGRYVIFTYIYDSLLGELKEQDTSKMVARVEKSIETVSARMKDFSAPAPDKLMDQDIDLDGMLARALPTVTDDQAQRGIPGVYDRHGGLQLSGDPGADAKLFEETGVDRISWKGNLLYRAKDAAAAQRIAAEHSKPSKLFRRVEPPKNLPFAHCREYIGGQAAAIKYYCTVSYDRYAADVDANQLADVHQRTSAQYAILANSK
ncbi:hypothetical protein [Nocardia sp. NPDC052566]|uniref:DUF7373 family lipoprotein n=1 Tax=Nocardia sp. NPDC052566 TaxID=3364330 RepID=UPI0037CABD18